MKFFKRPHNKEKKIPQSLSEDLLHSQEIIENMRKSPAHRQISNAIAKAIKDGAQSAKNIAKEPE